MKMVRDKHYANLASQHTSSKGDKKWKHSNKHKPRDPKKLKTNFSITMPHYEFSTPSDGNFRFQLNPRDHYFENGFTINDGTSDVLSVNDTNEHTLKVYENKTYTVTITDTFGDGFNGAIRGNAGGFRINDIQIVLGFKILLEDMETYYDMETETYLSLVFNDSLTFTFSFVPEASGSGDPYISAFFC